MAFVAADWSITRSSKEIRYIGDAHAGTSPSYATGIEFHRALQDFADQDVDSGDDELSIIDDVPSSRGGVDTNITLLNGYNIDDASSEHLYDTSITQADGAEIYDGIQVFGNSTSIQVIQDGARLTNDFWNEAKMLAAVSDSASSTTHRFLVKVRVASADIDGRRLLGTQRVYGTVYTEFSIGGGTNRGNNVLALNANSNLNNATAEGTVATYTDIVNDSEGYAQIDVDADTVDENYYSDWELGARSKNDFYERAQWLQREGSVSTLYGLNGDIFRGITHSVAVSGGAGTWVEPESLSWGSGATAGTGQLLAVDNTAGTSATVMYIQLLSGVIPNANTITGNGGATGTTGTVTPKLVSLPFAGASTGTAIIGAYGLGVGEDDLIVADLITALDGVPRNPPNNVTFNVTGLAIGDYVFVGPESAGILDVAQDTLAVTLNGATETSIVTTGTIPIDTPTSGSIRVYNDEGRPIEIPYTSYSGSTYTIPSYDFSGSGINDSATSGNNILIGYIDRVATSDTESFTTVYNADRNLVVRVRFGGVSPIVPFETVAILGSNGGNQAASRVSDE